MGLFSKIFGNDKPIVGDARVVEVLLDSIKVGADPATQVAAVRSMMGDTKDETFTGYLDELAGITGDEDKKIVAKAIDVVKDYYVKNIAGDSEEPKKDVEEPKQAKQDVGDSEDTKKAKQDVGDSEKPASCSCQNGDAITPEMVAKMVAAEFAKRDAQRVVENEPKVNGDELSRLSAIMTGDNAKDGVTSDALMREIFN